MSFSNSAVWPSSTYVSPNASRDRTSAGALRTSSSAIAPRKFGGLVRFADTLEGERKFAQCAAFVRSVPDLPREAERAPVVGKRFP